MVNTRDDNVFSEWRLIYNEINYDICYTAILNTLIHFTPLHSNMLIMFWCNISIHVFISLCFSTSGTNLRLWHQFWFEVIAYMYRYHYYLSWINSLVKSCPRVQVPKGVNAWPVMFPSLSKFQHIYWL